MRWPQLPSSRGVLFVRDPFSPAHAASFRVHPSPFARQPPWPPAQQFPCEPSPCSRDRYAAFPRALASSAPSPLVLSLLLLSSPRRVCACAPSLARQPRAPLSLVAPSLRGASSDALAPFSSSSYFASTRSSLRPFAR